MLVSAPPPHSAEKFSPAIASGLRSLLESPPSGGVVVTRALAAASRGCGGKGVQEIRDGASIDEENAKAEQDKVKAEEEDEGNMHEEEDGCWVSYGRREPRRRLPPPIPTLRARGVLRRTRADDGRLVVRVVPAVWPECTRARRSGGRLTMHLVEHDAGSPMTLVPAPLTAAREDGTTALVEPDDDTAIGGGVHDDTAAPVPAIIGSEGFDDAQKMLPVVPPPRVPSAGCFEDVVFKYDSTGGSSLHQMPTSLIRMVH